MFKRLLSITVLILFSVLLVACRKEKPPVEEDTTKPFITVPSTPIKHMQGVEVNLLEGITVVDNVDGVLQAVIDNLGGYDKDVVGEYTITVKATDKAGNFATATRKVIVEASFTRLEFNGHYIKAQYNPKVLAGYTNTGFNTAYDTTYAIVLTTDYVRHILKVAPERLGANTGWSIIYVADKDGKLKYARDFQTNEFWIDEEGYLQNKVGNDWCTGTATSLNAKYCSSEMGLMMANIEPHLEEGGYVLLFLNSGTNGDGTPRYFAASHILSHEDNMKGLGQTFKVAGLELSENPVFNKDKTFPIITVPGIEYVDQNKIQRLNTRKVAYVGDPVPNLLNGVTATNGRTKDITSNVTYKVYEFTSATEPHGEEVSLDGITSAENAAKFFLVVYEVTEDGFTDKVSILLEIKGDRPDQLEVDSGDTLFGIVLGDKVKLDFNNLDALKSTDNVINLKDFDHGQMFTKDAFTTAVKAAKETNTHNGEQPFLNHGVVVIMDRYYAIQKVRVSKGGFFEIDASGKAVKTELTWSKAIDATNGGGILADLDIPEAGYVIIYPETKENKAIDYALTHFYNKAYVSGEELDAATAQVSVKYPVQVTFEQRIITNVESFVINDTPIKVKFNDSSAFFNGGSGANMRLAQYNGFALIYDKEGLTTGINLEATKTSNNANGGLPLLSNGVVAIFDKDLNLIVARVATQSTDHRYEIYGDGTFKTNDAAFKWNATHANNPAQNGILKAIDVEMPADGFVVIFPLQGNSETRDFAIRMLFNADYKSGGITSNPEAENKATNYIGHDEEYITNLVFEHKDWLTDIPKPARIVRPKLAFEHESTIKWTAVENAAKYALYINGALVKDDITGTEFDLSTIVKEKGTYSIQLRAISSDVKKFSNSVLSGSLAYEVTALDKTTLTLTEDTLSWTEVEGATTYLIYAGDEKIAEVAGLSLDMTTILLYPTEYKITVVAASNLKNVLKSIASNEVTFLAKAPTSPIKLNTPEAKIEESILKITLVKYASFYQVFDAEGKLITTLNADNPTLNLANIVETSGNFTFTVKAIAKEEETYLTPSDAATVAGDVVAKLRKVEFTREGNLVRWGAVPSAGSYDVYVEGVKVATVTKDLFYDMSNTHLLHTMKVEVVALPANEVDLASDKSAYDFVVEREISMTIGDYTLKVKAINAEYFLKNRNINPFASITEIYLITNPYDYVRRTDLTGTLTANSTVVLVDSKGKLKLVRGILGNHQWLPTNDQEVNNGWAPTTEYAAGIMTAESLKPYIAEGDMLFIAKSSAKQTGVDISARDFLAYYYQVTWTFGNSEGWRGTIDKFHNPKDVTYTLN